MWRKICLAMTGLVSLAAILLVAACGGSAAAVNPTWITPVVSADSVSLPLATVHQDTIVHFWVTTSDGKESFMAYQYGGQTYVRADICPPCRSVDFSLKGDILVCGACGTRFNAVTGKGVSGACVAYPKAEAKWETSGANMVISMDALKTAYRTTVTRSTT